MLAAILLIAIVLPALIGAILSSMVFLYLWRDRGITFGHAWFACAFGGGLLLVMAVALCIAAIYVSSQRPPGNPGLWLPASMSIVGVVAVSLALPAAWTKTLEADPGSIAQLMAETGIDSSALAVGGLALLAPSVLAAALAVRFSAAEVFPGLAGIWRAGAFTVTAILPCIALTFGLLRLFV